MRAEGSATPDFEAAAVALEAMAKVVRFLGERAVRASVPLLKPKEVARRLAVGESTVYRLVQERQLAGVRVADGALRVEEAELARFIKVRATHGRGGGL